MIQLIYEYNYYFFSLQMIFYLLSLIGNLIPLQGLIGKVLYLPTFLVNSNYAAIVGLYRYLTRQQTHLWQRVKRA